MKTLHLPSLEKRLSHYEQAIELLKVHPLNEDDYGLCIVLGDIAYENFFKAPWGCFEELVKYYPELTEPDSSPSVNEDFTPPGYTTAEDKARIEAMVSEAIKERITILKNASCMLANYLNH